MYYKYVYIHIYIYINFASNGNGFNGFKGPQDPIVSQARRAREASASTPKVRVPSETLFPIYLSCQVESFTEVPRIVCCSRLKKNTPCTRSCQVDR